MKTFVLATNVFFIFFIFTINEVFSDLINIKNIYKLPKINDTYESYQISEVLGSDGKYYKYENILSEEAFFKIVHNTCSRRIPKRNSNTYNYNVYSEEYKKYCLEEHTSYELSKNIISESSASRDTLNDLQSNCLNEIMTKHNYDDAQMLYRFLPQPDDTNGDKYFTRIDSIDLDAISKEAKEIYDLYYKIYIELPFDGTQISNNNKQEYFVKLLRRRAVENEANYGDYALRILAKGFYPLDVELFLKEYVLLDEWTEDIEMEAAHIN